jgi:formylglycine-generating enzyme required for sulfatase activity
MSKLEQEGIITFWETGKMRKAGFLITLVCLLATSNFTLADTFGTGANQFAIDFVNISGDASSANGTNIGEGSPGDSWYRTFTDPENEYRMGTYEITNAQWNKFKSAYGTVAGSPASAYDTNSSNTQTNVPANNISWYEAAQFVNWLNTSTGHQAAYKFTGTIHTSNYNFVPWGTNDTGYNASNPFRNSNAFYFLPTEDEWIKAAYWNGTALQTYALKAGDTLHPGDSISGTGWNYYDSSYGGYSGLWNVGSGSEELNGTFDIMGNAWEWIESPFYSGDYSSGSYRGFRGGSYASNYERYLGLSYRGTAITYGPYTENMSLGFRVAAIPEPATLLLLAFGAMILQRKK